MAQDLALPDNFGLPSQVFGTPTHRDEMSEGVTGGFGVMGYRGKVWRAKFRGNEDVLTGKMDGQEVPRPSIEVIVVKASPHVSKNWYENGYEEGNNAAPDCYSIDGLRPDPTSPKLQNDTCQLCPRNRFGLGDNGRREKECKDHKRLAIVPLGDINNETYGGPMLLRVPPASLGEMATFSRHWRQMGYSYFSIASRIGFDQKEAYPKLTFNAIRALTDDEAARIVELQADPRVELILGTMAETMPSSDDANPGFEQPAAAAPAPARPAQAPARAAAPANPPNGAVRQQATAAVRPGQPHTQATAATATAAKAAPAKAAAAKPVATKAAAPAPVRAPQAAPSGGGGFGSDAPTEARPAAGPRPAVRRAPVAAPAPEPEPVAEEEATGEYIDGEVVDGEVVYAAEEGTEEAGAFGDDLDAELTKAGFGFGS